MKKNKLKNGKIKLLTKSLSKIFVLYLKLKKERGIKKIKRITEKKIIKIVSIKIIEINGKNK